MGMLAPLKTSGASGSPCLPPPARDRQPHRPRPLCQARPLHRRRQEKEREDKKKKFEEQKQQHVRSCRAHHHR